ncbi:MAG: hypothetical protein FJ004_05260 [Chloroflexi bacterium]|nr:hypothetical protein [Chloroflexota bacterium]
MIRSLQLTDVPALLLFLGKAPRNEARARDRLGAKGIERLAAASILKGCLISADKQHSFVCVSGGFVQGLACLRRGQGPSAWFVERLMLEPEREESCIDLLERVGYAGDKIKAERVFLRVDSSSPAADMAKQAGFNHYLTELLYRLDEVHQSAPPDPLPALRPKTGADEHALFRLFSASAPLQVRSAEGMTLQEWTHSRDRDAHREMVQENTGEISAWLRIRYSGASGQFEIVAAPGSGDLASLADYALTALKTRRPVYCLVPEYQQQLRRILEDRGFYQAGSYSCFSKQLAVRVHEPQLVPLRA